MNSYDDIFKIVYKRIRALLGRDAVVAIFDELDLIVIDKGKVRLAESGLLTYQRLEELIQHLNRKIGPIALLSFKIPVLRKARRKKLKLPEILLKN